MKKISYIICSIILFMVGVLVVDAASFSVSSSARNVVVGNTFNVTVTVNGTGTSSGSVGAWTYCVSYDSSVLTLTSPASPCINDGVVGFSAASTTFTFKAKQSSTSTISLTNAVAYDYISEQQMDTSKGSVTITARTQSEIIASYSTNADLSDITVEGYELKPSFNKDTLEYELEVENDVEKVNVSSTKADYRARVNGGGEIELSEGINKVEIVVTAEKGNQKTYVVSINRKELNPINITVNGNKYSVIRKAELLEAPPYYVATTAIINDTEVPAFKSEISGYTLVGLKNETGDTKLFIYNINDGSYREYKQVGLDSFILILEEPENMVDGYSNVKNIKISNFEVSAYYKDGTDTDYVLVYGMNLENGQKNWYQYDIVEGTFQRFQNKEVIKLQQDLKDYMLLIVIFASGFGLSLLSIIVLLITNRKAKKNNIRLMAILENGKVVEKDYEVEEIQKDEEETEDEEEATLQEELEEEQVVQAPKKRRGRKKKLVSFDEDE